MTSAIHQPHDKLFKLSLAEIAVAKDFFSAHLPAQLLKKIDLTSLKLQKQSFIDAAYKTTEADVVYSANIGNETAYLYLLCEHQTTVDLQLAFRVLIYTVRLMETHLKQYPNSPLPLVYPMVIYTGDEPWNAPLDIFPLFADAEELAREILFKPYQLFDVKRTPDDDLRQQELSGLVAFVLKHRKTADFALFLKQFMPWIQKIELRYKTSGTSLGRIVLKYLMTQTPEGNKGLLAQAGEQYLSHQLQGEVMTIAQQWKQEGIQEGIQQGMTIAQQWKQEGVQEGIQQGIQQAMTIAQQWKHEGMQQGEAALLKRQLQHRFGDLSVVYTQRIVNADAQTLLHWGEKILDAETLEDVFN